MISFATVIAKFSLRQKVKFAPNIATSIVNYASLSTKKTSFSKVLPNALNIMHALHSLMPYLQRTVDHGANFWEESYKKVTG